MAESTLGRIATAVGAFAVGAGVAYLLASTLLVPPPVAPPPPATIHTVKILDDGSVTDPQDPGSPGVRVDPEKLTVAPGDVVQWVNLSELRAKVAFESGNTPLLQLSDFDVPAFGGSAPNLTSDVIKPTASLNAEFPYQVAPSGSTEQSPVIRIGPPIQSSDTD